MMCLSDLFLVLLELLSPFIRMSVMYAYISLDFGPNYCQIDQLCLFGLLPFYVIMTKIYATVIQAGGLARDKTRFQPTIFLNKCLY